MLMERVGEMLEENCFLIENIDATIIAQAPKMRPYIENMRENIAQALHIEMEQVNIKATTEEGLGFTGAGEGIAAQAVCLLNSPRELWAADVTALHGERQAGNCAGCAGCAKACGIE